MSTDMYASEIINEKANVSSPPAIADMEEKHGTIITVDEEEERRILRKIDFQ